MALLWAEVGQPCSMLSFVTMKMMTTTTTTMIIIPQAILLYLQPLISCPLSLGSADLYTLSTSTVTFIWDKLQSLLGLKYLHVKSRFRPAPAAQSPSVYTTNCASQAQADEAGRKNQEVSFATSNDRTGSRTNLDNAISL